MLKQERFRREQERAEKEVPTSVLAKAFLELRTAVAETRQTPNKIESHEVQTLTELLREHPNIRREFASLVRDLLHTQTPSAEGKLLPIDTSESSWKNRSQAWIEALLEAAPQATREQREAIRRSAALYFQTYASVLYARTLERFVQKSISSHQEEMKDEWASVRVRRGIETELTSYFDLSSMEARHFVSMYFPNDKPVESLKAKIAFLREAWESNAKHVSQRVLAEAAALTVVSSIVDAVIPSQAESVFKGDRFSLQAYLAGQIVEVAQDILTHAERQASQRVDESWKSAILRRKAESMLFRRREHADIRDERELRSAIDDGEYALEQMQRMVVDRIGPTIVGMATTLAAMGRIHPLAALAGTGAIPLLGYVEHLSQESRRKQHKERVHARDEANKKVRTYADAREDVQLSADAADILETVMNAERRLKGAAESAGLIKSALKDSAAKYAANLTMGVATYLVQHAELAQGKSLREFSSHLKNLNADVKNMARELGEGLDEPIQEIRRMEQALGPQEEYDIPGGPREQARLSASELPSHDVSLRGLWYGVLQGVSETIREGEFVHIAGGSGSGKSTILKQVAGVLTPAYGEVQIGGVPQYAIRRYGEDSLYQIMAYAGQEPKVNTQASVRENLLSLSPSLRVTDDELRSVLRELGLDKFAHDLNTPFAHDLSGGERVRFGIAKALVRRPKILLLDEPTGPLDQPTAREVWRVIDRLHASHPRMTVIVVTHDPIRLQDVEHSQRPNARVIHMDDLHARSEVPPKHA